MNQEHIDKLKNAGNSLKEEKQGEMIITVSSTAATSTNPYKLYSTTATSASGWNITWDDKWSLWQ